jgi:hypothetical protein
MTMRALAFDFSYDADEVQPAPGAGRRLYAVRGTVGEPPTDAGAPSPPPVVSLVAASAVEGPRLDVLFGGAWTAVENEALVSCPVCTIGTLAPRWSAGAGVIGGRCGDCGSTLD